MTTLKSAAEKYVHSKGWEIVLWDEIKLSENRFWSKVNKTKNCWKWTAGKSLGYGVFSVKRKLMRAHRISWSLHHNKPIPKEGIIDHVCGVKHCVNPKHLDLVDMRENTLRGTGPSAINSKKKKCQKGHSLSGENLLTRTRKSGGRDCKKCKRERLRYSRREFRYKQGIKDGASFERARILELIKRDFPDIFVTCMEEKFKEMDS